MSKTIFKSEENKLTVTRTFDANITLVWSAWTEPELLDQWWAPKPWKSETSYMNFAENGYRIYAMVSPEGERHMARTDYKKIKPQLTFSGEDSFCESDGTINTSMPIAKFKVEFAANTNSTIVILNSEYQSKEHLEQVLAMGMKEGLNMAFENLDEYIKQQFKLRSELKLNNNPRVTTYLNFPGNTEEAFNFYKTVFKTEFSGKGIQRFGDIPAEEGHPPVPEAIKKMILHVELPTIGGHVLMATDAPKEMGFTLNHGNNMHICLEPESREETKRLFDLLSKEGNITMPLEDMFFGAYFGECTDKYGINWMFNFKNANNQN